MATGYKIKLSDDLGMVDMGQEPQLPQANPYQQQALPQTSFQYPYEGVGYGLLDTMLPGQPFHRANKYAIEKHKLGMAEEAFKNAREASALNLDAAKRLQAFQKLSTDFAPELLSMSNKQSEHYQDLTRLAPIVNRNPEYQQFFGGRLNITKAAPDDDEGKDAPPKFNVEVIDPQTGAHIDSYRETAPALIDRMHATLDSKSRFALEDAVKAANLETQRKLDLFKQFGDAEAEVKQAVGLTPTIWDKYMSLKKWFPDAEDWQHRKMAGLDLPQEWETISERPLKMGNDGVGVLSKNRKDASIKVIPLKGVKFSDLDENRGRKWATALDMIHKLSSKTEEGEDGKTRAVTDSKKARYLAIMLKKNFAGKGLPDPDGYLNTIIEGADNYDNAMATAQRTYDQMANDENKTAELKQLLDAYGSPEGVLERIAMDTLGLEDKDVFASPETISRKTAINLREEAMKLHAEKYKNPLTGQPVEGAEDLDTFVDNYVNTALGRKGKRHYSGKEPLVLEEGHVRVNKKTGKQETYRNGQWVPTNFGGGR